MYLAAGLHASKATGSAYRALPYPSRQRKIPPRRGRKRKKLHQHPHLPPTEAGDEKRLKRRKKHPSLLQRLSLKALDSKSSKTRKETKLRNGQQVRLYLTRDPAHL